MNFKIVMIICRIHVSNFYWEFGNEKYENKNFTFVAHCNENRVPTCQKFAKMSRISSTYGKQESLMSSQKSLGGW